MFTGRFLGIFNTHKQVPQYQCSYLAAYRSNWIMFANVLNGQKDLYATLSKLPSSQMAA